MKREQIEKHKKYKITYPGQYKSKIAEARGVDMNGDVTLEFKNGNQVVFHENWLVEA